MEKREKERTLIGKEKKLYYIKIKFFMRAFCFESFVKLNVS